jgi:DNA invertase Pin-like site-specific DNA recombinase
MRVGYARVSTHSQKEDTQIADLKAAGCEKIFTDKTSGKNDDRPELKACLAYMRDGEDEFVITRLSRAMRSMKHLLDVAHDLDKRGIGLVVLKQNIDTTTPTGRLFFHLMAAFDEYLRELIVEGTREGLAEARANGNVGGRPKKIDDEKLKRAKVLRASKQYTMGEIAAQLGVARSTLYESLKDEDQA